MSPSKKKRHRALDRNLASTPRVYRAVESELCQRPLTQMQMSLLRAYNRAPRACKTANVPLSTKSALRSSNCQRSRAPNNNTADRHRGQSLYRQARGPGVCVTKHCEAHKASARAYKHFALAESRNLCNIVLPLLGCCDFSIWPRRADAKLLSLSPLSRDFIYIYPVRLFRRGCGTRGPFVILFAQLCYILRGRERARK